MKKLFLAIFLFFSCAISTRAARVNFDIENILIDAQIKENGDMDVTELLVLDGVFNGYEREITYRNSRLEYHEPINYASDAIYNAKGITNMRIKAGNITTKEVSYAILNNNDFLPLTKVFYDVDATNGDYFESSIQDGRAYKMYYKSDNDTVAFLLSYTLEDAVVLHNDVGELYWTFIGAGFDDQIMDLQIRVTLPKEDTSNNFRVWAHGDLTGNVEFLNQQTILATIKKVAPNTAIDVRLTFASSLLDSNLVTKKTNVSSLDQIIAVEEERALDANLQREQAAKNLQTANILCLVYIVVLIAWWIYVYIRFDREYKSDFALKYNREFIDEYNVEVVDYLMNHSIGPNAMSASILNLIYKKNIVVNELPSQKKKQKNYEFTLVNRNNVNDTEDVLLDFLFETVGKENKFTAEELKKYAGGQKTFTNFQKSYTNWQNCAKKDGEKQKFYETNGLPIVSSLFFFLIAFFIVFFIMYLKVDTVLTFIVIALSIVYFIYALLIKKRTKKGNEHYVRWKAFKNFLADFGRFDIKELPAISLWERYLVYATVFGLADEVEKAMSVKINEFPEGTVGAYYPSWVDFHIAHMVSHSISSSFASNQTAITNSRIASSSRSSGSGFGGGFSSGGGFGGGGGGGHGF